MCYLKIRIRKDQENCIQEILLTAHSSKFNRRKGEEEGSYVFINIMKRHSK